MARRAVRTNKAPQPIGAYTQAIVSGGFVFVAGQGPVDLATGGLIASDEIADQTRATLEHLKTVLEAAGSSLDKVVKVTVYLKDIKDFKAMNAAYAAFFPGDAPPARTTIQAANLYGKRMKIEIDCIAEA